MELHNAHVLAYYSTDKGFRRCFTILALVLLKKYGVIHA